MPSNTFDRDIYIFFILFFGASLVPRILISLLYILGVPPTYPPLFSLPMVRFVPRYQHGCWFTLGLLREQLHNVSKFSQKP
jgi:hypothetical protein